MKKILIGLLLILSVTVVACNRQMTVEEANAAFCQNLQAFDDALTNLDAISATSTVGELKDASADVDKAWNEVTKSASQLHEAKLDTIDETWKNLRRTVNQINNSDTLAAAAANVGVGVKEIKASYSLLGEIDCPTFTGGRSSQESASDAQPVEPSVEAQSNEAQPAEAPAAEPAAPGLTGTYSTTLTLPDTPAAVMVLVLNEDGTVFEVTRLQDQTNENILVGQWQDNGDETVGVTLTESMDKNQLATPIVYVFKLEGDQLIAVDYDETIYGPQGFSLQRMMDPALAADVTALAAQASSGITSTASISDTALVTASETLTDSAPLIAVPPATSSEPPAEPPGDAEQAAPASSLVGSWQLQEITQTSGMNYAPETPGLYVVTFNAIGTLNVTADCNTGVGAYQAGDNGTLTIDLSTTCHVPVRLTVQPVYQLPYCR
ncbi:MAG: hypothetical protein R2844_09755 [Caldilineales bacterium]